MDSLRYSNGEVPPGSVRRQETMSACKAPVVQEVEPCLPLAKYWAQQGIGKKVDCLWLEEPESHPKDPVLRKQSLYSFQHINGFNFSFFLSASTLFESVLWNARTGECICHCGWGPAFHSKSSLSPKQQGISVVCLAWASLAVRPAGLLRFPYRPAFSKSKLRKSEVGWVEILRVTDLPPGSS